MKYMILTYGSQQDYDGMAGKASDTPAWTAEEFSAMTAFMAEFNTGLSESGELVETRALAAPRNTQRVRLQGGVPVVTDGPYAETLEVLAGYWIIECDRPERALEIAQRLASCPGPEHVRATAVADLRPIVEFADDLTL